MSASDLAFRNDEFLSDDPWRSDTWFKTQGKTAIPNPQARSKHYGGYDPESFFFYDELDTPLHHKEFVLVSLAGKNPTRTEQPELKGIPIYRILEAGAIIIALLSCMSLGIWVVQDIPLIHPVFAVLALVGAPFVYLMGRAARATITHSS